MKISFLTGVFISILFTPLVFGELGYPTPVDPIDTERSPFAYTGLIASDGSTGSGSVVIDPKLVMGCAHLNYADDNTWLPNGSIQWFWKWNEGSFPGDADGIFLTGYYYFSSYRDNVIRYGDSNPRAYQWDIVANYSATQSAAGGYAGEWVEDGKTVLTTKIRNKMISGYPSGRYLVRHPDKYRMHATWFNKNMVVRSGSYLGLSGVETGPGNSGGPIWVWNGSNWAFAGVLVSGSHFLRDLRSYIGVCSLKPVGWSLIIDALDQIGGAVNLFTKTVSLANVPLAIPDKGSAVRTFTVSGLVGGVKTINLSLVAPHQRRGDLIVTLRSPTGKTVALTTAVTVAKSSPPNLTLSSKVVSGFSGLLPNGLWTLTVKDSYRNNTGSLQSASIQITTR